MIRINLKKVCSFTGEECENQTFDHLEPDEKVIVSIENIPFIEFRIDLLQSGHRLVSYSPVSLRTYTEQSNTLELWGDYENIGACLNKVISVVAGFINGMGKTDFNDGNYYKDDVPLTNE